MAVDEPSVGTRAMHGMLWAYGSFVAARGVTLVATAILARLLDPSDFGVVALALVFTALLETVADLGVGQALIVTPEQDLADRADLAFKISVALGAALSLLVAALGPLMAVAFDEEALSWLMGLLAVSFLLRALGSTHYALAERQIDFRARMQAEVADVVLRGIVSIALALAGAGAAALVLGYLAGSVAHTVTLWAVVPWRPRLRGRRRGLGDLVRFGAAYSGLDALVAVTSNVDYLFVGRVLGAAQLGLYTMAYRLPGLVIINLPLVAGRVLFPALATVTPDRLPDAFLVTLRYTMMLSVPVATGLAALAEPVVLGLFGPRWEGSIDAMRVLTLYGLFSTVNIPAGTAYKATGRPRVLLALTIPELAILVASIALVVDHGIVAVAACEAGVAALVAVVSTLLAKRLLAVPYAALLGELWAPLVAAAVSGAAMYGVAQRLPTWPALFVGAAVGAALYLGVLWVVRREALVGVWRRLGALRRQPVAKS
jgi:lipopolysaccharide exporter